MRAEAREGLVSVVVPAFNAELSLKRCLDSILAQTYAPLEVIVVDDGSTDGTARIAGGYGERVLCLGQRNAGETAARNRGFDECRGEFVTFIDHDDHWAPEFVGACVEFLRRHPEADAVSTASRHRSALGAESTMPAFAGDGGGEGPGGGEGGVVLEDFFSFWAEHNHLCAGAVVMRRGILLASGGQRTDLALSGDLEFWARLGTLGRFGFIPRTLLFVDGTQVPRGGLYRKYRERYARCTTVEDWERRIVPGLRPGDRPGFERVRGRVATWFVFAKLFVGEDAEARRTAMRYRGRLEGRYGALWKAGTRLGAPGWKLLALAVRARTRLQYRLRERP